MTKLRLFTIAATLLVLAGVASAQGAPPPPPPPGGYTVGGAPPVIHTGLHFNVHLGFAYTNMSADDGFGNEVTFSGPGGAFGLSLGYAVKPNLIVYGELFDAIAVNPNVEFNGQSGETEDANVGVIGVGIGLKYYMMPANIYVGGTLAMAQLSAQENGEEVGETDFGPGVLLKAGKEWLVGTKLGVGIGAQLFFGTMPEKDADFSWTSTAFALVGSLSYN
jgi:hypothetical protein